jgi:hypothetical protein
MNMNPQQKQPGSNTAATAALGVVALLVVVYLASNVLKTSNTLTVIPTSNATATTETAPAEPQKLASELMTIKNTSYKVGDYGIEEVVGEITNNDSTKHMATIKATFYAADGSIKGTAGGAVNDIAPGETKTFELTTTDKVSGYKDMKVQVDTLL